MPYVLSIVLVAVGLLILAALLFRTYRAVRRFRSVQRDVAADVGDHTGLIKARFAGIRVGLAERRRG